MSNGHTMGEARKLADDIRALRPDLTVENHRDYGYAVDLFNPRNCTVTCACQPGRDDIGQRYIFKTAEAAIAEVAE